MFARSPRTIAAAFTLALACALVAGQPAARAEMKKAPAPTPPATSRAAAHSEIKKAPARASAAHDRDLYACHPNEDLACTVVHETAQGVVVVTFRPSSAKETRVWSVVNEPAPPGRTSTGGTIYVVPAVDTWTASNARPPLQLSANDSPIID